MLVMQFKVMINELQQYQCTDYSYDLKHKRQFKPFLFITGGRSSTSVNGDIAIQWEWSNFDHS